MSTVEPQIHILRSPENQIVLAHGHDALSHHFVTHLLQGAWADSAEVWEGQAVFPLDRADELVQMAKFEGLSVVDGPECLGG